MVYKILPNLCPETLWMKCQQGAWAVYLTHKKYFVISEFTCHHPFGLVSDAKLFNLQSLIQFIDDQNPLKRSSIIGSEIEYRHQLHRWLQEKEMIDYPSLLYSAEDDGWTAAKFHELCDGKGPTLVLIESEHGCIFGGSTSCSWAGNGWCKYQAVISLISFK